MQQSLATEPRPSRAQIEPAALKLLSRHSAGLLATARRYSATPEDAEDAYQRGVEILLTKAPSTSEDELLPWLKTVVKHEAFAVRKLSGRMIPAEEPLAWETDEKAWTHERAERYEQLRVGAEAMAGLKPQEIRCLVLKAEGLSYQEICEVTGFSYTKVNRSLTEGRRAFLTRVAGIETGAECDRLAPLISKVADGEASPQEMRVIRPHLKGCLACKATLREYRATPARLAGLVPPVAAIAAGPSGFLARLLDRFAGVADRFAGMSDAAGGKVAAVAASAVVIAGGGAAGIEALHHDAPAVAPSAFAVPPTDAPASGSAPAPASVSAQAATPAPGSTGSSAPDPSTAAIEAVSAPDLRSSQAERPTADAPRATTYTTDPKPEFDPGTTTPSEVRSDPPPAEFGSTLSAGSGSVPPSGSGTAPTPAAAPKRAPNPAPASEFGP